MAGVYSRRSFISHLGLFGCALPLTAYAQRAESRRVRLIGFLIGTAPTFITAFEEELRRLGFVDGKSLIIERRISLSNTPDLTVQAAELAQMDLGLIVAAALPQALEVRKNNPAMPMVIALSRHGLQRFLRRALSAPAAFTLGWTNFLRACRPSVSSS